MRSSIEAVTKILGCVALMGCTLFSGSTMAAPGNGNAWGAGGSGGSDPGYSEPPPLLSFDADATTVSPGGTVLLSWAALNVRKCSALGDWDGQVDTEGFYRTPPIDGPKSYTIKCNASGGGVEGTINIAVTAPEPQPDSGGTSVQTDPTTDPATTTVPQPDPVTVSLSASPLEVEYGGTTTLSWSATGADSCTGWNSNLATSGSYTTPSLSADTSFTLSCSGAGGSDSQTVSVTVLPQPEPVTVSLSASPLEVEYGGTTTLSWSATGADSCTGWGSNLATSGSYTTPSLSADTSFTLSCSGAGGSDSQMVAISVLPPPEPSLKLSSSSPTVKSGGSVTLSWSGQNVSNCQATGAWTGGKNQSGSELNGPLSQDSTFTLSCQSATGDVVAMTSVLISEGGTTLSWEPPHENVDGTPLSDLTGYRVYVGLTSRNYNAPIELADPLMSSYFIELLPGDYYIAMTAVDAEGNESAFSNEVLKTVN